ncbi:hypothetical protein LJC71_11660 [Desulfosarcina sp. OttesenSCG-928-A07]|nr:hypothetical protein [Desulfosarcina sp. OttesenSCG-928-G17]MDL2330375.1 hypothetical protein [Desulfosarcina sp. OttesenSCG-928-A07]
MNTNLETRKKYDHILIQAAQLDRQTQMELLVDLAAQLRQVIKPGSEKNHRLKDLQGLFRGAWEGQDAQDYVNRERDEWDG